MALDKHPTNYTLGELGNLVEQLKKDRDEVEREYATLPSIEKDLEDVKREIFKRIGTTPPPTPQDTSTAEGESETVLETHFSVSAAELQAAYNGSTEQQE